MLAEPCTALLRLFDNTCRAKAGAACQRRRSLQRISFCFGGAINLLAVEKCGPAPYQREDPGALLHVGPEERRCWYTVGVSVPKTPMRGHYGMHPGPAGILFSLQISETLINNFFFFFALLKREIILYNLSPQL